MGTGGEQGIVDAPGPVQPTVDDAFALDGVADRVVISLPPGGRAVVVSDLHLTGTASAGSARAADALASALEAISGPAVVVLAGDCFEMLVGGQIDPEPALAAHPQLTAALAAWGARSDRTVVVLPGNHDGPLGWHPGALASVRRHLGATIAFSVDLDLACGTGSRLARVEHGHQLDPANAFADPRDPAETPLGAEGVDLYITGHTHIAELTATDGALYANSGCGGGLFHRRPGRGPLPDAFAVAHHVSWIDLTAGEDLEVRLVVGFEERPGLGRTERWATAAAAPAPVAPTVVGELAPSARCATAPLLVVVVV